MKTQLKFLGLILLSSAVCPPVFGLGTSFTYQGRLQTAGGPANGVYDLSFALYDTNQPAGNLIAGPVTNPAVAISNGLFTVALDFGNVFDGSPRWLEAGVRTNGGSAFTVLGPRQAVTPAPYALNATMLANGVALGSGGGNVVGAGDAADSFIGGGSNNVVDSPFSFIGGGNGNLVGREWTAAVIGGGSGNVAGGNYGVVGGGYMNEIIAPFSTVGGGSNNVAGSEYATVGGGEQNRAGGVEATVGGGSFNTAGGQDATVSGGFTNFAGGDYSAVSGGEHNWATGEYSFIGGGNDNAASQLFAMVCGGQGNIASGQAVLVAGGEADTASGNGAVTLGGSFNSAAGYSSIAAGTGAESVNDYSFVWADGEGVFDSESSDQDHQFKIQARNGVVMDVSGSAGVNPAALFINSTSANGVGLYVLQTNSSDACIVMNTDASLHEGAGDLIKGFGWSPPVGFGTPNALVFEVTAYGDVTGHSFSSTSDRNAKENFAGISPAEILEKVLAIPISQWNFKGQRQEVQHIGPMAQDFHAAFGLNGSDDKRINLTDEGGVALAAIQGLNQKLLAKDAEIAELKARLEKIEQLISARKAGEP